MTTSINLNKGLIALAVIAACISPVAFAHAADLSFGDSYADAGYDIMDSGFGSSYADGGYDILSGGTGSYADYGYDTYSSPSYFGGYGCSSCGGYGFSGFGGFGGSGFTGGGYVNAPTYINQPTTVTDNGNTYAPTNICTGGNVCNTPTTVTINNASSPAPSYPVYTPVYQPVYQPITVPSQPIAPIYPIARAPYVSLSAVPYTGLDLGPMGTALYWGFLVLWCLFAAYLIVVKRVQNKVVAGLSNFLFGAPNVGTHAKVTNVHAHVAHESKAHTHVAPKADEDAIDPFIASQISR